METAVVAVSLPLLPHFSIFRFLTVTGENEGRGLWELRGGGGQGQKRDRSGWKTWVTEGWREGACRGGFLQPGKKSLCAFAAPLSVIVAVECTRKVLINYLSDSDTNFLPEASF